jgi:hypothetical protein
MYHKAGAAETTPFARSSTPQGLCLVTGWIDDFNEILPRPEVVPVSGRDIRWIDR